jgi:hypothetical protein
MQEAAQQPDKSAHPSSRSTGRRRIREPSDINHAEAAAAAVPARTASPEKKRRRTTQQPLIWDEEQELVAAVPGDPALIRRRLTDFDIEQITVDTETFVTWCETHFKNLDKIEIRKLIRSFNIRCSWINLHQMSQEDSNFLIQLNRAFRFDTDHYVDGLIALSKFVYNDYNTSFAIVYCVCKNAERNISHRLRKFY